ncbi:hypothetical protein F1D05_00910 [Kribbella qitaiheensis]|uniref:Uncharacterized protein n=1 Tax=Kribbella qitaiheensis TaxID=1544730 RepID=A0A7G6WRV5_9ACTN|nr:hypothetical protein [Kribbella qitaiheensis]QNE16720.1 hypothetical protein F1D05_00910 [Kribbella qitaiheensis]
MTHHERPTVTAVGGGVGRRSVLLGSAAAAGGLALGSTGIAAATPLSAGSNPYAARPRITGPVSLDARKKTLIGIGYETWFMPKVATWNTAEAIPVLGRYRSDDVKVIRQHAEWISGAGFDFILIDWSNNLSDNNWTNGVARQIIDATDAVFAQYVRLPRHPKIALLIGTDSGGAVDTEHFREQLREIRAKYLGNPQYRALLQEFRGKPLLSVYRGPNGAPPPTWDDSDFTLRYMTALHEVVGDPGGQWSWIDRAPMISGTSTAVSQFGSGVVTGGQPKNGGATPPLKTGETVGQSFTFSGSSLTKLSVLLATYGSATSGITMTLYSGTPDGALEKIAGRTFTDFADNSWQDLVIEGAPAGQYYLELSDPAGTPAWWFDSGDSLPDVGGSQYLNRVKQSAGRLMTFTFYGTADGPGGLNGWQVGPGWTLSPNSQSGLKAPEGAYPTTRGATKPGVLSSPPFEVSGTFIHFFAAGIDQPDNSGRSNYFLLKDATTGQVLRREHTPNTADYFVPISWDVRELLGRKVVFTADNRNATGTGWMAVCNISQQVAEFSVAAMAMASAETTPGLADWSTYSAKPRMSGATLVWYLQDIFAFQPEVMLIQQWNEFVHNDQYDVARSNDIEPTRMSGRDGPDSDGWGTYYLDLVGELIKQYRGGARIPAVRLDTRYP